MIRLVEDGKGLSMGYGFLEFETAAQAADVLKSKQGVLIDGHAVQLQVSRRGASKRAGPGRKASAQGIKSSSICVRNVAFEATRKELYQLFGAYGTVTSCRLPKKSDYSGHRGFAFLDFASRAEAQSAFEALQHSHLYGRRLVIATWRFFLGVGFWGWGLESFAGGWGLGGLGALVGRLGGWRLEVGWVLRSPRRRRPPTWRMSRWLRPSASSRRSGPAKPRSAAKRGFSMPRGRRVPSRTRSCLEPRACLRAVEHRMAAALVQIAPEPPSLAWDLAPHPAKSIKKQHTIEPYQIVRCHVSGN